MIVSKLASRRTPGSDLARVDALTPGQLNGMVPVSDMARRLAARQLLDMRVHLDSQGELHELRESRFPEWDDPDLGRGPA